MKCLVALVALVALLAVACSAVPPDIGVDVAKSDVVEAAPTVIDRLAILRPDGTLVTVDSLGENEQVVSQPGGPPPLAVTWSKGAERLAWSQADTEGPHIWVTDGDGNPEVIDTPFLSFFLMWDRQGTDLAALGSGGEGTALVTVSDNVATDIIASGSPLYLSWAPDGGQLAARRSGDLAVVDLTGGLSAIDGRPAQFATSIWLPDGRVVFSLTDGEETVVSVGTPGVDDAEVVFRSGNSLQVVADDAGERLAIAVLAGFGDQGENDGLIPAAFGGEQGHEPTLLGNELAQPSELKGVGLYVAEIESGLVTKIDDDPGLWWSWSPDGTNLLVLQPSRSGAQASARGRWRVWDGQSVNTAVEAFAPTRNFINSYLPFAAQWDQAIDLWSSDGKSFAFAGVDAAGNPGIFMYELDGGRLTNIGPGYFVTWAPGG